MGSASARLTLVLLLAMASAGCEIVGDIFKAGIWVGVIMVVLVIALVLWLVGKVMG